MKDANTCLLISDFTIENFARLLTYDQELPQVDVTTAPFGQVYPVLLNDKHDCWNREYDFAVVWTQPQGVIESYLDVLNYQPIESKIILEQVDAYLSAISNITHKVRFIFIPTWVLPLYNRGWGMLDLKSSCGISSLLMQMNMRLSEYIRNLPNVFVLDTQRWIACAGPKAFNPKLWYMGKVPYTNEVFSEAIKDVKAAINGASGLAKKLIVVDLDDTLWGGIVGDDGWENLHLGGHNALGESYVDFQRALKSFTNRGILLGIVSKNEEGVALEAIEKHPEMVLKPDDFAGWRINWNDKAKNIIELVEELNLGLQSVVFLDDNPVERARVRESLPEVFVPEMPEDKMLYASTLLSLRCFDAPSISQEDLKRTEMYISDRKRKSLQQSVGSIDKWLKGLQTEIQIEKLKNSNIERATQLLNKTNQMNLSTRRLLENELKEWENHDNHWLRTFRVSDKMGDSGLTGIISLEVSGNKASIVDFILSCRVMGRKVEEIMVHSAYEYAKSLGLEILEAEYIPTKKNMPCLDFWKRSGFEYKEEKNIFTWKIADEFPLHDYARIIIADKD
jgi:FkbH-like protein